MKEGEPIKSKKMTCTDEHGLSYTLTFSEYEMIKKAKEVGEKTNELVEKQMELSERSNDLLFKTKRVMKVVAGLLILVVVAVTILYFKLDSMNFMKICYTALR